MKHSKPVAIPSETSTKLTKDQPDMQEQIRLRTDCTSSVGATGSNSMTGCKRSRR
jgi:hypothetical protein